MIDIIDTYTAADDELKPACGSCRIDDGLSYLCCGADYKNIEFLYLFRKLFRLIELLNDLVTLSGKSCCRTFFILSPNIHM